jgi:hypothetical protein
MQNCMASNAVQSSAGLLAALPLVSGVTQTIPNTVVQNPNMQSIPGVSQNSVGNSMRQGIPSTMFANSQKEMPGNALFGSFMSSTYGIRNATAIGTIAITHAFGITRCPSVLCTNFSPPIMVLVSNAFLGSFMCYCCHLWH